MRLVFLLLFMPVLLCAEEFAHPLRTWQPIGSADIEGVLVKQSDLSLTVRTSAGRTVQLTMNSLGVEDRRYLQNLHASTDAPRTWTFITPYRGQKTLQAAYISSIGEQNERSKTYVELILDDGRRRSYPVELFSKQDRAYVTEREVTMKPRQEDTDYVLNLKEYDPKRDPVTLATTAHFAFWWGRDENGFEKAAANWKEPAFREMNLKYFETIWSFYRDRMQVPMPHAKDKIKYKINVYVTGTGLAKHQSGFAFGSEAIIVHPGAMLEGSSVLAHEFTHVLQFYMGGFRDNSLVGFFWENHANWSAFQFIPDYPAALEVYADRAHYELNSSRHNYGSWPILQYLCERPGFKTSFPYDIWQRNKRNERGASLEDPFQVIMRCAVEDGLFTGDGVEDFGDVVGEMAAHNVAWDYVNQYRLEQVRGPTQISDRNRTLLHPIDDRPGWYAPWYTHAPRQYGYNLIDLIPKEGVKSLSVNLEGVVEEGQHAAWRATIVAVDDMGRCRYSRQWKNGEGTLDVQASDRFYTLAIAATPSMYVPLEFRIGYNNKRRYTYEVSFNDCTPASRPPREFKAIDEDKGTRHVNGGGWVSKSAKVDASAYIGPHAQVRDGAKVLGQARIEDYAVVMNGASVADEAVISDWAVVREVAKIGGHARVRDCAEVSGHVQVTGDAQVARYAHVDGQGTITDQALIRGFGEVHVQLPFHRVGGGTIMGEDLEAHVNMALEGGMAYGFLSGDILKKTAAENNHHLFANWVFRKKYSSILRDWNADCDGRLRGNPTYGEKDGKLHLQLDGKKHYALVEGDVICSRALTIDAVIQWEGGVAEQRLFDFSAPDGSLWFTPSSTARRAEFGMTVGGQSCVLSAKMPLKSHSWQRVTAMMGPYGARLFIDGKQAAENTSCMLSPASIATDVGYLGRGRSKGKYFNGNIERISLYRTTFSDVETMPAIP